jgi:hypothetical protein
MKGIISTSEYSPPSHIMFHVEKLFESYSPWLSRSRFEHETTELWVEYWTCFSLTGSVNLHLFNGGFSNDRHTDVLLPFLFQVLLLSSLILREYLLDAKKVVLSCQSHRYQQLDTQSRRPRGECFSLFLSLVAKWLTIAVK